MNDKTLEEEIHAISKAEQPIQKYWAQLTSLAGLIFLTAVAYQRIDTLADDVAVTQQQANENSRVAQIAAQRSVRIESNQERFKEDIETLKKQNEKLDEKLDKILEEVRKQ